MFCANLRAMAPSFMVLEYVLRLIQLNFVFQLVSLRQRSIEEN